MPQEDQDRLQVDMRHGGSREHRQGQSKVRVRYGYALRYDSEDELG